MSATTIVPLFPLGLVLLPHRLLPLHIFEDRYKEMIAFCLQNRLEFGVVCFDGKNLPEVGCLAAVTKVLKEYADGKMDILTVGRRRFRIRELIQGKSYLQARIDFISDKREDFKPKDLQVAEQGLQILENIAQLQGQKPFIPKVYMDNLPQISFVIAACDGFTIGEQQHFLEMVSVRQRLHKSVSVLEKIVERLQLKTEIEKIIGSNGHLPDLL